MASPDRKSRRPGLMTVIIVFATAFTLVAAAPESAARSARAPTEIPAAVSVFGHSGSLPQRAGIHAHGFVGDNGNFITIDAPRADLYTVVFGIGDDGRTVGGYADANGKLHGFVRSKRRLRTLDFPGAAATFAARINSKGQIVGAYGDHADVAALELPHGFLLDNGKFTRVDFPGARRTQPYGINARGQIVGEYVDGAGATHGFLLEDGAFTTLDVAGRTATFAMDIDDSGRIVGFSFDKGTGTFHGLLVDEQGAFHPLDAPGAARGTLPFGINNRGQIVGIALVHAGDDLTSRAFVLENGVFTTIEHPKATRSTVLFDVNDSGQLAGVYDITGHGYICDRRGDFAMVALPEGAANENIAINDRGQIAGRYVDATGKARGFLEDRRGFTAIDVPGASATSVYRINDRGQMVGVYSTVSKNTGSPVHGFVLDAGRFTTFDFPGAVSTEARDIDNQGKVVGNYQDAAGATHGFLRDGGGTFKTIDVPGAKITQILGINERGQMVGGYLGADGVAHGFVLLEGKITIIDEPGALVTVPYAINNRGQIVGVSTDGVRNHGFFLSNGRFIRVTPPGAFLPFVIGTFTTDINDWGWIAGASL